MKDYTKPCTREENPDHIILHVGTNDLSSDNSPERVGKSIVDLAKNLFHDNRKVTISDIIRRNDEWNSKAELVNNHFKEICKSANIDFIDNEPEYFGNKPKSLCTSNLHLIQIAQININSIRNKFEALVNGLSSNVDILMISEIKIDDSFPLTQFLIEGLTTP